LQIAVSKRGCTERARLAKLPILNITVSDIGRVNITVSNVSTLNTTVSDVACAEYDSREVAQLLYIQEISGSILGQKWASWFECTL